MDVDSFASLLTPLGVRAVEAATQELEAGSDPLRVATEIRRRFDQMPAQIAAAAITQAQLRRRGRAKFGAAADLMWFTPDGLEQATRTEVADHRAARFARLHEELGYL
ncbi:MAG: SAM-dependent methyltransferase, partial [Acidothermaceae bacterium]